MPIKRELRHLYRGPKWEAIRARILARAKNRCEQCGKPNHERVETVTFRNFIGDPYMLWRTAGSGWWGWGHNGKLTPASATDEFFEGAAWRRNVRSIVVQLGVAHLNHKPGDDRDSNLKALCNWCHLHYDQLHHKATRSIRKDAGRPLLQEAS